MLRIQSDCLYSACTLSGLPLKRTSCEHFEHVVRTVHRPGVIKSAIVLHAVEGPPVAPHLVQLLSLLLVLVLLCRPPHLQSPEKCTGVRRVCSLLSLSMIVHSNCQAQPQLNSTPLQLLGRDSRQDCRP